MRTGAERETIRHPKSRSIRWLVWCCLKSGGCAIRFGGVYAEGSEEVLVGAGRGSVDGAHWREGQVMVIIDQRSAKKDVGLSAVRRAPVTKLPLLSQRLVLFLQHKLYGNSLH